MSDIRKITVEYTDGEKQTAEWNAAGLAWHCEGCSIAGEVESKELAKALAEEITTPRERTEPNADDVGAAVATLLGRMHAWQVSWEYPGWLCIPLVDPQDAERDWQFAIGTANAIWGGEVSRGASGEQWCDDPRSKGDNDGTCDLGIPSTSQDVSKIAAAVYAQVRLFCQRHGFSVAGVKA